MSYLEMIRWQAKAYNAEDRKAAKELKSQNRRAADKKLKLRHGEYMKKKLDGAEGREEVDVEVIQ